MKIGICQIAQAHNYPGIDDAQVYREELDSAILADELGYDLVSMVEHHFEDYALCPDNFVYLAHLAARTKHIRLMTGAVIVPWNIQPLRVAEKAALLDTLCDGRLILGLGRGLARREFEQMGVPLDESRGRFDEAVPMILDALRTGVMAEHEGRYFRQPRAVIRPRPTRSFDGRVMQVAMSGDSVLEAAKHGVQMMQFVYKPVEVHQQEVETYRKAFGEHHDGEPPVPLYVDFCICDTDAGRAEAAAQHHIREYLAVLLRHYEMMGEHFAKAKGYEEYGQAAEMMRAAGLDQLADEYVSNHAWGTPQQILDKLAARRAVIGPFDSMLCVRFAGVPYETVERTLRTFAAEVMPELRGLEPVQALAS